MRTRSPGTSMPEAAQRSRRLAHGGVLVATWTLATTLVGCSPHAGDVAIARTQEPRAYGWHLGDVVSRRIDVEAPAGLALEAASLPRIGVRGGAVELRQIDWLQGGPEAAGAWHSMVLHYQLMRSPPQLQLYELPAVVLRFLGKGRVQEARVDGWGVLVSPLAPTEAPTRRGLGALRPDAAPMPIDTHAVRQRMIGYAVAAVLLLGYLACMIWGAPWQRRRNRPFAAAWRALRRLPADRGKDTVQTACARLHAAFNASGGEVLFAPGIDRYVAQHPRFGPLREELVRFFRVSRQLHFGTGTPDEIDLDWVLAFCRRCRDAERGSA